MRLLYGWLAIWRCRIVLTSLLLQHSASACAAMMAATALFLRYSSQMSWMQGLRVLLHERSILLRLLFCCSNMDAFLLAMMRLLWLSTITFHVSRSFLAFVTAVLALCNRPTFLRYKYKFSV